MKTLVALVGTLSVAISAIHAQPAQPVKLMVLRTGDGTSPFKGAGALSLLEIQTDGTPEKTTIDSVYEAPHSGDDGITSDNQAKSEGQLSLSTDGQYLVFTGYGAEIGGRTGGADCVSTPRVVARFDLNSKTFDTSTRVTDAFNGIASDPGSIRGAITIDGNGYWMVGKGVYGDTTYGVRYVPHGGNTSVNIFKHDLSTRAIRIFNNEMYVSRSAETGSGIQKIKTKGSINDLVHERTASHAVLPGASFVQKGGYNGFQFAKDGKLLFVACGANGIQVFSMEDGLCIRREETPHTLLGEYYQLDVKEDQNGVHVFFVRSGEQDNALYVSTWTEDGGFSEPVELLKAGRKYGFRGLSVLP